MGRLQSTQRRGGGGSAPLGVQQALSKTREQRRQLEDSHEMLGAEPLPPEARTLRDMVSLNVLPPRDLVWATIPATHPDDSDDFSKGHQVLTRQTDKAMIEIELVLPWLVAQVVGALSSAPKGCGFDPWLGHTPGLLV